MTWWRTSRAAIGAGLKSLKKEIRGRPCGRLRRILHLPAFTAVRFGEPTCQALFERVNSRSKIKMKGYIAVQKRLPYATVYS